MTTPNLPCKSPDVGSLLPKYFADLLDDPACEEVERHLEDCGHCKSQYLTLLSVLRAGRAKVTDVNSQNGRAVRKPTQPAQPAQSAAAALATAGAAVQPKGNHSVDPNI